MIKKVPFLVAVSASNFFRRLSKKLGKIAVGQLSKGDQRRLYSGTGADLSGTEEAGDMDEFKHEMLSGIIEMEETVAKEVMVPRTDMVCVEAGLSFEEVLSATIKSEHSRIPVYRDTIDNIIGILYTKDLIKVWAEPQERFSLEKMVRPTYFIPETKPITVLLREFQKNRVHIAIVVDEYGGIAGLITLEDILEEIIGEIQDEYDDTEDQVTRLDNGDLLMDARMDIELVEELLGINIEKEEFESLGGFAINILGHVPLQGENFSYKGYRFTVEKATDRKVVKIKVAKGTDGDNDVSG